MGSVHKMIHTLVSLILLISYFANESEATSIDCPTEDWLDFDDLGCYHFGSDMFSNMTYFEAAYYCHRLGVWAGSQGILAEPVNDLMQAVLTIVATDLNMGNWWIGG